MLFQKILTRIQRLKDFVNNHTRPGKGEGKPVKLDLSGKARPKWQAYQAYSYLYYNESLRGIIVPEYASYVAALPEGAEPAETLFTFRNRRLRELLELETDEVKAAVEEQRQKSPTMKEEKALERLTNEGLSEDEAKEALRTVLVSTCNISFTRLTVIS